MALGLPASSVGRLPARELTGWAAFERVFGPITLHERLDVLVGMMIHANVSLWAKQRYSVEEFVPKWDGQAVKSPEELFMKMQRIAESYGNDR